MGNLISRFYSSSDLSSEMLERILQRAESGKKSAWRNEAHSLDGKVIGLIFFNPSLRTRSSFQAGISKLGGSVMVLSPGSDMWSLELEEGAIMNSTKTEHIKDAGPVLSSYCDALCLRSFAGMQDWQSDKLDPIWNAFSQHVSVPLISMESALWHPCQALADALTLREVLGAKQSSKTTLALTWAPHPKQLPMAVPNSTLLVAAQSGFNVRLVCPSGYDLDTEVMNQASGYCEQFGTSFDISHDSLAGLEGADVVYAKSWTPAPFVGRAEEELAKRKELSAWGFTPERHAASGKAWFMHCLPVRRNVEVFDEVLDSERSLTMRQAENRLHVQNAMLLEMLGG